MELATLDARSLQGFIPHHLHNLKRSWPETNCYIDLWIEVLSSYGLVPEAAFGFAVTQDFGFDQFTFSKIPLIDIELLYGLKVRELSIYRSLEYHIALHIEQGHLVILEADSFYLPDTFATTYQQSHTKTTIAVNAIDTGLHECEYFHNAAHGKLLEADYIGVFNIDSNNKSRSNVISPYVEVVENSLNHNSHEDLRHVAGTLLKKHLGQRPERNPFSAWQDSFHQHLDALVSMPSLFHDYAFHFPRSAGSNFEMLSSHLEWLDKNKFRQAIAACQQIAGVTKIIQYKLARCIAKRKVDHADKHFNILESSYLELMEELNRHT